MVRLDLILSFFLLLRPYSSLPPTPTRPSFHHRPSSRDLGLELVGGLGGALGGPERRGQPVVKVRLFLPFVGRVRRALSGLLDLVHLAAEGLVPRAEQRELRLAGHVLGLRHRMIA